MEKLSPQERNEDEAAKDICVSSCHVWIRSRGQWTLQLDLEPELNNDQLYLTITNTVEPWTGTSNKDRLLSTIGLQLSLIHI